MLAHAHNRLTNCKIVILQTNYCKFFRILEIYSDGRLHLSKYGSLILPINGWKTTNTIRAPVFGTSEYYWKAHGSLLSGWINFITLHVAGFLHPSNILILPSQFWQIRFESYWLHCSKCRILVLLWYIKNTHQIALYTTDKLKILSHCSNLNGYTSVNMGLYHTQWIGKNNTQTISKPVKVL